MPCTHNTTCALTQGSEPLNVFVFTSACSGDPLAFLIVVCVKKAFRKRDWKCLLFGLLFLTSMALSQHHLNVRCYFNEMTIMKINPGALSPSFSRFSLSKERRSKSRFFAAATAEHRAFQRQAPKKSGDGLFSTVATLMLPSKHHLFQQCQSLKLDQWAIEEHPYKPRLIIYQFLQTSD